MWVQKIMDYFVMDHIIFIWPSTWIVIVQVIEMIERAQVDMIFFLGQELFHGVQRDKWLWNYLLHKLNMLTQQVQVNQVFGFKEF